MPKRNFGFSTIGVRSWRSMKAKRVSLSAREPSPPVTFAATRHRPFAGSGQGISTRASSPAAISRANGISKRRPKTSWNTNAVRHETARAAGLRTTSTGFSFPSRTRCSGFPVSTSSRIASASVCRNAPTARTGRTVSPFTCNFINW